ncbi:hypothetical protein ACG1BZ_14120 [Microbulbifer sp. CNSA002]|uniref:hypothetical protein n=1 Tax=Microbulbifer sp. CNSA002 TaxID=3373604 RepID=UPI0039B473D5
MNIFWFYGDLGKFFKKGSSFLTEDCFAIYEVCGHSVQYINSTATLDNWSYVEDEIIVKSKSGEIHLLQDGKVDLKNELLVHNPISIKGLYAGVIYRSWREKYLAVLNLEDDDCLKIKGGYIGASTDGNIIFTTEGRCLLAFDLKLEMKWSVDLFSNRDYRTLNVGKLSGLYFIDDLVVVNRGLVYGEDIGQVIALSRNRGEVVWEYTYQGEPEFSFMEGDKYFLVLNGNIIVLNGITGEFIQSIELGLGNEIIVFPNGNDILVGSNKTRILYRYSLAADRLISIGKLPNDCKFCLAGLPYETDENICIQLRLDHPTLKFARSGLLVVEKDCFGGRIDTEKQLASSLLVTEDSLGERVYLVKISCNSIDDLRRLGAVLIAEYAYTYGEPSGVPLMTPDKSHKGKIKVVVDRDALPSDAEEKLRVWVDNLSENFAKMAIYPGAGQDYQFSIDIELS